jgi:hypothetical protein
MNTLIKLPNFPVSICTQDGELTDKEIMIDADIVEDNDGFIKFLPYVDPKLIYMSQHNSSIGKTWTQHNSEFAKFIYETEQNKIVDIGGGSGNIFNSFSKLNENVDWTIIDLNPPVESKNLTIIQGLYDSQMISKGDVVVTSHFVEHLFDLKSFLDNLHDRNPSYHIFSLPNFSYYAKNRYCSTLMFEHPNYLAEECLKYMLEITGWEVVDKKYFKEHSIFFKTRPIKTKSKSPKFLIKNEVVDFLDYMKFRADSMKNVDKFYVFGAHFPFYYLLSLGVKEEQIIAVIDNDVNKQNKRMYGTNIKVISSDDVPVGSNIFIEMGPYNEEIKETLLNMNFI